MTAQIPDQLIYQNRQQYLYDEPLHAYFMQQRINPRFRAVCTALWRGYLCTWQIKDRKLWLIDLQGILENDEVASMETFFPGHDGAVLAGWYTGCLRVPQGEVLNYVHMGYASQYERDLFIEIEAGVVTGERLVENGVAEQPEVPERMKAAGFRHSSIFETIDDRFPLRSGFSRKHFPLQPRLKDSGLAEPVLQQFLSIHFDERGVAEAVDDQRAKLRSEGVELEDRSRPVWLACATPDIGRLRALIQSEPGCLTAELYRFVAHRALRAASKAQASHFVSAWSKAPRLFHDWEVDTRAAVRPYLEVLDCLRTVLPMPADADWLTVSILADELALLQELLALGADPDARDSQGRLPMVEACGRPWGQPFFEQLLQAGAYVNGTDFVDNTPLLATVITQAETQEAHCGRLDCLLRHGAKVDPVRSHDRSTPLMHAIILNKLGYLRRLLMSGANPYLAYLADDRRQVALDLMGEDEASRQALARVFEEVYAELWRSRHPGEHKLA